MANTHCPLCGGENKCGGNDTGICWCTNKQFPQEIFMHVPEESLRKHCICEDCLERFKEESRMN